MEETQRVEGASREGADEQWALHPPVSWRKGLWAFLCGADASGTLMGSVGFLETRMCINTEGFVHNFRDCLRPRPRPSHAWNTSG